MRNQVALSGTADFDDEGGLSMKNVWVYYGGGPQMDRDSALESAAAVLGGDRTGSGCGLPDGMRDVSFKFKTKEKARIFAKAVRALSWVDSAEEVA